MRYGGSGCPHQKFECGQTGRSRPILSQWEINHSLVSHDRQKQWRVVSERPLPPGESLVPAGVFEMMRSAALGSSGGSALVSMIKSADLWGSPRVHGELVKLGISISERAVARPMPMRKIPPSQIWRTFLDNHLLDLVSEDHSY